MVIVVVAVVVDVTAVTVVAVAAAAVVVGSYSPVAGNCARGLCGSTPRDDVGLKNPNVAQRGPPSGCSRHGGQQKSPCFGRRSPFTHG